MDDMMLRSALCVILQNQVALCDMLARAKESDRGHMQDCANRIGYVSEPIIKALGGSGSSLIPAPLTPRDEQA